MQERAHFAAAAAAFSDLVAGVPPDAWTGPGLGVWDLRSLVGHASRSLITVDTYLNRPAASEAVPTVEAYYGAGMAAAGADPDAVAERGRQAGLALGKDPVAAVRALVDRVVPRVSATEGDPVIETIAGGMRLSNYLATRTFELVVHSLDIAAATGLEPELPAELLAEAAALAARIAVTRGQGRIALLALTGRTALPPGFSVV